VAVAVVVAFVSQKGGVGKSTLARGFAALLARAGLKVRIADLDVQQHTVAEWDKIRQANAVARSFDVRMYPSVQPAVDDAADVEILVLDAPGRASQATLKIASAAHLVIQPTGGGVDDLRPGVLLFHELVAAGIERARLAFALCRTHPDEEEDARTYLEHAGYNVLPGALPEQAEYRTALNRGRSITETARKDLNARADALMLELMGRVAAEVRALQERETAKASKSRGVS
jgi:chromosome partitioning protein